MQRAEQHRLEQWPFSLRKRIAQIANPARTSQTPPLAHCVTSGQDNKTEKPRSGVITSGAAHFVALLRGSSASPVQKTGAKRSPASALRRRRRLLLADDHLGEGLDGEELRDLRGFHRGLDAVGGDFAEEFAQALLAGGRERAAAFEFGFGQGAAGVFDDLAARDLHFERALEAEDDVEEINGLRAEVADER